MNSFRNIFNSSFPSRKVTNVNNSELTAGLERFAISECKGQLRILDLVMTLNIIYTGCPFSASSFYYMYDEQTNNTTRSTVI